jgi:hypothetical protein
MNRRLEMGAAPNSRAGRRLAPATCQAANVSVVFGLLACKDSADGCSQRSANRNTHRDVLHGSTQSRAKGYANANAGTY